MTDTNVWRDMWEPILKDFSIYHPKDFENIIDWYPSGQTEITIKLKDGTKKTYNWLANEVRNVYPRPTNQLSDDDWKRMFSNRLRHKLMNLGIQQQQLSDETGISYVTINKYIKGKAIPNAINISRIAKVLHCSVDELVDDY